MGQQAALTSTDFPELLDTVAPLGRVVGTGQVGEGITVSGISATASGESSTDREVPPPSSPM